jgi:hypothetical protein
MPRQLKHRKMSYWPKFANEILKRTNPQPHRRVMADGEVEIEWNINAVIVVITYAFNSFSTGKISSHTQSLGLE